jgi:hypothetical protein
MSQRVEIHNGPPARVEQGSSLGSDILFAVGAAAVAGATIEAARNPQPLYAMGFPNLEIGPPGYEAPVYPAGYPVYPAGYAVYSPPPLQYPAPYIGQFNALRR